MTSMAMVPPRDPSKWAEWQEQIAQQRAEEEQLIRSGIRQATTATQAVGTRTEIPRVMVIMVNFADYKLVSTQADVDSMFNGLNWTKDGATGSVRQYFYDQSNGAYNPRFDIVGEVTLANGYAYYGYNSGKNNTAGAGYMVTEACDSVNSKYPEVNFADYDLDNDGKVDLVYLLFAGFGENDPPADELISDTENLPWPHYWNVNAAGYGSNRNVFDGKQIYAYEISNELDGLYSSNTEKVIAGIGVVCHEFGHALGLPDLYATVNATHKLLGCWDIMCYGPYNNDMHTPPSFSAYERFFMGWLEPTLITEPDDLQLEHIATSNQAYLISETDEHNMNGVNPNPNVFYLLENRQKKSWDIGVPGNGMLLTRINYLASKWSGNTVNNTASSLGVDIIEADGLTPSTATDDGAYGKAGDAFPKGATEYLGIDGHVITDITMSNRIVSFKYRGGKPSDPTAVEHTATAEQQAYKTIENGQIIIHNNGQMFSIYGLLIE